MATPATAEIGSLQALFSVLSPHPTVDPDAQGLDHDDDDDFHLLLNQASFDQALAISAEIVGLHGPASVGPGGTPIPLANLSPTLELLPTSGLENGGVAGVATIVPSPVPSPSIGLGLGPLQREQGRQAAPQAPVSQPLIVPPDNPAADKLPLDALPGDPFAQLLPIDVEAIRRGADAFFEQLTRLSEEWQGGRMIHELTPWLLAAGLVSYEWFRLRRLRTSYTASPNEDCDIEPTLLLAGDEG